MIFTNLNYNKKKNPKGFVLIYTLFVSTIMLLITTSISVSLIKQIYFSRISRQSQVAYFAADSAVACTISVDDTYVDAGGLGIFPYDSTSLDPLLDMQNVLDYVNSIRSFRGLELVPTLNSITCAQSSIFDDSVNDFTVSTTTFSRPTDIAPFFEEGKTSTFTMRMDTGDGTYRCARVTVNKTPTYRQIIAQGYASCDSTGGTVERAIVNVTVTE